MFLCVLICTYVFLLGMWKQPFDGSDGEKEHLFLSSK